MTQIDRLLGIMRRLRDPENGCPWDKEQTFATIAPYTLEETYEVLDAISREDFDDLRGELGDLLFQVVFYAQMVHEAQQAVVDEAKLEEEVGDLLFATVNLSRHLGVKAEVALQKANRKFERRFREVERIVAARGLEMTGVDLDTMEEVWQQVKRQETDL